MSILLSLLIQQAFAGGSLTTKYPAYSSKKNPNPEVGLYINEPLTKTSKFYYQSWTGGRPEEWFSTSHELMYKAHPRFSVGAGPAYNKDMKNDSSEVRGNVVLEVKLW